MGNLLYKFNSAIGKRISPVGVLLSILLFAILNSAPGQGLNPSGSRSGGISGNVEAQMGTDDLPRPPAPAPSGPFGERRNMQSLTDQAIIKSEQAYYTERDGTIAYARGRTRVEFNQFTLEADRMVIDFVSEDIQVEGNVIFTGPDEFIRSEGGRFNLGKGEGVAYGVNGQVSDYFFAVHWDEGKHGPAFRQLNERESIFRGTRFTTNDFPVPMYYVTADEIIFIRGERVYLRNPVLHIRGVPCFWLPFYSRSLGEGSPWFQEFGYNTRLGAFFRLGYRYIHRVRTPSFTNPEEFDTRSHGMLDTYGDMMSERGLGIGARYRYQFEWGRHTGYLETYGIRDDERNVANDDTHDRWVYRHKHNSLMTRSLLFQADIDRASDPDLYVDILDRFAPDTVFERGRLFEQSMSAALTDRRDNAIARIQLRDKQRLTRDRYTDFSDPFADDLDFDPDPDFLQSNTFDDEGINPDRYATVSRSVLGRYSTRLLNLGQSPLFYRFEANAFRAMDAGFNQGDKSDDDWVNGVDMRGSLNHRLRLGKRTTWSNAIGIGSALYDRDTEEIASRSDFDTAPLGANGERIIDGTRFPTRQSTALGNSDTVRDMRDTDTYYLFADYQSRLNHRFTDFLDGYISYKLRRGTDDSLGEYYESVGRVEAAEDIYDFYTNENLVEAGLNFFLRYPNLTTKVYAGQNLDSSDDVYPNEKMRWAGTETTFRSPRNEFTATAGVQYQERAIRDRADPDEYIQGTIDPYIRLSYFPRHSRYWARLNINSSYKTNQDPVDRDPRQKRRFDEENEEVQISPTLGRKFGPKYRAQIGGTYTTRYDNFRTAGLTVIRDLHDAELGVFLGVRNNSFEARRDDRNSNDDEPQTDYEGEVRVSLRLKINRDQPGLGNRSVTTLSDLRQEAEYVR